MADEFAELLDDIVSRAGRFGHREHVELTWQAVRRYGTDDAIPLISEGIRRTARYHGAPQKYHATVSRAWVELVGFHVGEDPQLDFDAFVGHHSALLDKRLLTRFYNPSTLAAPAARTGWVEPDREPFPWQARPGSRPWWRHVADRHGRRGRSRGWPLGVRRGRGRRRPGRR